MEIIVNKELFLKEYNISKNFKETGKSEVFLKANEDSLELAATRENVAYIKPLDLEIVGEEDMVKVYHVITPGEVQLPTNFEDVCQGFPDTISIKVIKNILTITSVDNIEPLTLGDISANLSTIEAPYPEMPKVEEGKSIAAPKSLFTTILDKVGHSVAISDSRPILKGIYMAGANGSFSVVATDSSRLSKLSYEQNIELPAITIPEVSFKHALAGLNEEDKVTLIEASNWLILKQENTTIYIRLLDGNFPDTSKLVVLPENANEITAPISELVTAIRRTLPFKTKKLAMVTMYLEGEFLVVSSKNEQGGISSKIAVTYKAGEKSFDKVAINAKYLMSAIESHRKGTKVEEVKLIIQSAERPMFVTSEDQGNVQLVLPIRTHA